MAEETRFFEQQLDRTSYGACWGLAGIVLVTMLVGGYALWQVGTLVRHIHVWQPHLPLIHPTSPAQLLNSAQQSAQQNITQSADAAKQQAQDAAKGAADRQLNQFLHP